MSLLNIYPTLPRISFGINIIFYIFRFRFTLYFRQAYIYVSFSIDIISANLFDDVEQEEVVDVFDRLPQSAGVDVFGVLALLGRYSVMS